MDEAQEKPITEEPKPSPAPREGGSSGWLLWVPILFFLAYPLSIGPAARLHQHFPRARPFIEAVYKPITLLIENCRPVRDIFLWYLSKVWKIDD